MRQKPRDLLDLTPETDIEILVNDIVRSEPLISEQRKPQLRKLIYKLIEKIDATEVTQNFYLFKARRTSAHAYMRNACPFQSHTTQHGAARRSMRAAALISHTSPHREPPHHRDPLITRGSVQVPADSACSHPAADKLRVQQVGRSLHHRLLRSHVQGAHAHAPALRVTRNARSPKPMCVGWVAAVTPAGRCGTR